MQVEKGEEFLSMVHFIHLLSYHDLRLKELITAEEWAMRGGYSSCIQDCISIHGL